ncbi:transporter substrate-binding domain-containing protein [Brucella pseudogrignonensis]|uniref:transporter substrate-binding domain-containing protein n=1 Tax=Brucella pseudogrignonensis TaxID=419475 RepID=UPI003D98B41C
MIKFLFTVFMSGILSMSAVRADEVSVAFLTDLPPFGFIQNEKLVGFDLDLWAEIAKDAGIEYKAVTMDFGGMIPALQTGNIDAALASMFITEARKKVIDFSDTYYVSSYGVLLQKDNATIKSSDDLANKSIATVTGSTPTVWIPKNYPSAQLKLFPSLASCILEFQAGRVDAVVYDYPTLAYYVKTDGAANSKLLQQSVGDRFDVGIAFPKDSPLLAKVNKSLAAMRADGRYDAIHKKWLGNPIVE